jgi:hypothetical protein
VFPHGFWGLVGRLFKVVVVLAFTFLCCKASHANGQEADSMMGRVKPSARFKLVASNVFEQRAVSKLAERRYLLAQILEKCSQQLALDALLGC